MVYTDSGSGGGSVLGQRLGDLGVKVPTPVFLSFLNFFPRP